MARVRPGFLLLALSLAASPVAAQLAGSRPNIVLVLTDDQGYPAVGAHGHPWIQTPHLDRLHGEGLRFERFLVAPTCAPTRSALMTGRHPEKNGVTHTIFERERLSLDATTLPQLLQAAGYATGIFGKWHLGDEASYQPERRGFDEVFIHGGGGIGQSYDCSCADAPDNRYTDPVVRHNGRFVRTEGFCTDVFFSAALAWMRERAREEAPFFCYVATNAPHGPYLAPEKNARRFLDLGFGEEQAGFYGMIENIDENVGRLLDRLREWGLEENTLLVFLSDNGMTGGGSGRPGQDLAPGYPFYNAGMKGMKGSADEGGVRVPCFFRWPGRIEAGKRVDHLAAHLDILPTFAALAGASWPEDQVEGRSLLPLIESTGGEWPDRYLFTHVGRWPTGADPEAFKEVNYAVRNQRWRLVGLAQRQDGKPLAGGGGPALYDMEADPGQQVNLIHEHPEIAAQMKAAYDRYWEEARPLMVNETAPLSPRRPYHEWYRAQEATEGIPRWEAPEL